MAVPTRENAFGAYPKSDRPVLSLDAITFDLGSTVLIPPDTARVHSARAAAWCDILAGAGHAVEHEHVVLALTDGLDALVTAWRANEQFTAAETTAFCLERLGLTVSDHIRLALVTATGETSIWDTSLTPNIGETLARLKHEGLRVGIISDTFITPGSVWFRYLEESGLAGLFDHSSFSDVVGVYKPSPAIFEHAMAGLGVTDPSRMAHIGDLRRTDVAGARQSGWLSIRYIGVHDDDSDLPEADFVVKDHADLLNILLP